VKKLLYFAHPINTYGTALEEACLALIRERFPDYEIINPSDQVHKDKVDEMRRENPGVNVMPYFLSLAELCQIAVVLPFGDGMWGAGVCDEAERVRSKGWFVWVIDPATCKFADIPMKRLSVDETRARVRNPDGTIKPYA
jgi:hypothetical protein